MRKVYSKVPVDNGVWHSITIERYGKANLYILVYFIMSKYPIVH